MALSANAYGSVAGVGALVRDSANSAGTFDASTKPTKTEVEDFLNQRSAILNGWLRQAGYGIPVTQADALLILAHYANYGAACDVKQTQTHGGGGYGSEAPEEKKPSLCAEFNRAQAYIESGGLAALGVPSTGAPGPLAGLSVGGVTRGNLRLRPIFKRTSFGNDPGAESPSGRETDYTGDP